MVETVERRVTVLLPLLLALLAASVCGGSNTAGERASTALPPTAAGYPEGAITLLAPARPGGGW
ncbi:MAG: hypothetical protein OXH04_22930, partial [Acidobacteria bacterium]|nr:hypothetical protein [Acidobacteriota bacterium]